ncbi:MAG: EAL domain-containing protein [Solirubrobacteraceae bacterium]
MLEIMDRSWPEVFQRVCEPGRIKPVFAPVVELTSGTVIGWEGLARFDEPIHPAGPRSWFQAASFHGYSARLQAASLRAIFARRDSIPAECLLSVNVSLGALLSAEVAAALVELDDLTGLTLEIAEEAPVEDYRALWSGLRALRERGARFAVDDVASGYLSVGELLAIRPEFIKLGPSLTAGVDQQASHTEAARALQGFALASDAQLIAVGVERHSQVKRLLQLGITLAQGDYLGAPSTTVSRPAVAVASLLKRQHEALRAQSLRALAKPAPRVTSAPGAVRQTTVIVDGADRPLRVLAPGEGGRIVSHTAMCVSTGEDLIQVAVRAAERHGPDRFSPICLCDQLGRMIGVIEVDSVIQSLASQLAVAQNPARHERSRDPSPQPGLANLDLSALRA